jgi:putative DNA modification/repair radical SAM protein
MKIEEKLTILSDSAKYDVSCSSSGSDGSFAGSTVGNCSLGGICHTFSSDGRCISLLKVLFTNYCIYDCSYCINKVSNDIKRASFTPKELAELTINFYKRNYIEGLFLSSGIIKSENHTMELLIKTLEILRFEYGFGGYIHLKLIPNSDPYYIQKATSLANRVSSNIELPSKRSLELLAPQKSFTTLLQPMQVARNLTIQKTSKPISMSTQLIIGATPESDFEILRLSNHLYKQSLLKRVYFSAYIPVNNTRNLPSIETKPPLLREHRLYQADWLMRFYGFEYDEIVNEENSFLDDKLDPKAFWALNNLHLFPIDINKADPFMLIRIPGFGKSTVDKIVKARRFKRLGLDDLKNMKISIKRAKYFIIANKRASDIPLYADKIHHLLVDNSIKYAKYYQGVLF